MKHSREKEEGEMKHETTASKKKRIKCIISKLNPIVKRHSDGASHEDSGKVNGEN